MARLEKWDTLTLEEIQAAWSKMESAIFDAVKAAHAEFEQETGLTAEYIDIDIGSIEDDGQPERYAPMRVEADVAFDFLAHRQRREMEKVRKLFEK